MTEAQTPVYHTTQFVQPRSSVPNSQSRLADTPSSVLIGVSGITAANVGVSGHIPPNLQEFSSRQAQQSLNAQTQAARQVTGVAGMRPVYRQYGVQVAPADRAAYDTARAKTMEPMPVPDVSKRYMGGLDTRHTVDPALGQSAKSAITMNPDASRSVFNGVLFGNALLRGSGHQVTAYKLLNPVKPNPDLSQAPGPDVQSLAKSMSKEELLLLTARGDSKARDVLNERVWNQASQAENIDDIRFVQYNLIYKRPGGDIRAPLASRIFKQRSQHVSAEEYGYKRREIRAQIFPGSARIRG